MKSYRTKRKTISIILSAALILSAAGALPVCTNAAGSDNFEVRSVPLYRTSLDETETVECLFYDDLPNIPYIDFNEYYGKILEGRSFVTKENEGTYRITLDLDDIYGVINVDEDKLSLSDASTFLSPPESKSETIDDVDNYLKEYMPFLRFKDFKSEPDQPTPLIIDFAAYNIDIRESDGKIFIPLSTVSDMFTVSGYKVCYYNGKAIYLTDHIHSSETEPPAKDLDEHYIDPIINYSPSAEEIKFRYDELCFDIDYFYGFQGKNSDFITKMHDVGLDKALKEKAPSVRKLLLSSDYSDYLSGLGLLTTYYIADGGHTTFGGNELLSSEKGWKIILNASETMMDIAPSEDPYYAQKLKNLITALSYCDNTRYDTFNDDEPYHKSGDTAMFSFNSFICDSQGWKDYYNGSADMPYDTDTVAQFYKYLKMANDDPEIKNFVIDLSTNTGGINSAVYGICGLIYNKSGSYSYDALTKTSSITSFKMDRNFDGKFNEDDDKVDFSKLNFAVLVSAASFSNGNTLPSIMKENGTMILGERSGGGVCTISYKSTADGLTYTISSTSITKSLNGEDIDEGVIPHKMLVKTDAEEEKDYSDFYDLSLLSAAINEYYPEPEPSEPSEPSQEPSEPSQEPSEPSQEPSEPSQEPSEPSQEPSEPSQEPSEPSQEPSVSAQESDNSSQQTSNTSDSSDKTPTQTPATGDSDHTTYLTIICSLFAVFTILLEEGSNKKHKKNKDL